MLYTHHNAIAALAYGALALAEAAHGALPRAIAYGVLALLYAARQGRAAPHP